jgi:ADP-ribose pyrophosphatase YjhB (NUDIX family)
MTPAIRRAARALIIDGSERVLLFRGMLADREPWWFAPGGGLEVDETYEAALGREVREETGLRIDPANVAAPVWTRDTLFTWQGEVERHLERYFVIRVRRLAVDTTGFEPGEAAMIREYRWWCIDDIRDSSERFAPSRMGTMLASMLLGAPASVPLEVGE